MICKCKNNKIVRRHLSLGKKCYFCNQISKEMTFKKILLKLHNRYIYTVVIFLVVYLFIDQFNLFEQIRLHRTLNDQKEQIEFYEKEISESRDLRDRLENDTATMEQVARENYMMKRDNEIIYLIETQE